ncbi:hypothetical protein Tco_0165388, partial [Tanacetum coccineum]
AQTRGREDTIGMIWKDFKALMREELCLNNEMQKLETEFWSHIMDGASHAAYTNRFHKLARVGPKVVNPLNARNPTTARGACFECGGINHYKAAYPRLD